MLEASLKTVAVYGVASGVSRADCIGNDSVLLFSMRFEIALAVISSLLIRATFD